MVLEYCIMGKLKKVAFIHCAQKVTLFHFQFFMAAAVSSFPTKGEIHRKLQAYLKTRQVCRLQSIFLGCIVLYSSHPQFSSSSVLSFYQRSFPLLAFILRHHGKLIHRVIKRTLSDGQQAVMEKQSLSQLVHIPSSMMDEEENKPLSIDKPYFCVIFSKSHVAGKCSLALPNKMHHILPEAVVPTILTCHNKDWEVTYTGEGPSYKRFQTGWRNFVTNNSIKIGDCGIFELTECSPEHIKFRVEILDGELPLELLDKVDGKHPDNPVLID